ncbi:MAG: hypothetical protein QM831_24870 [Kofleriaceae bacterium]
MRVLALLLVMSSVGVADDQVPDTHQGQFGLSAKFGLGLRGIATYNSDYCGTTDTSAKSGNAPVCTGRSPTFLEIEPSYGVAKSIELTIGLHLGLEADYGATPTLTGPHPFILEPGARFFFSEAGHSKLFVQPSLLLDFSDYKKVSGESYGADFGVSAKEGYWLDLHRAFGFYVFVGESIEFARWLSADFSFGIGIQGRYP